MRSFTLRFLFILLLSCFAASVVWATGPFAWRNVNLQGMGYVTGMAISPLPPYDAYIRTDVGGAYRYSRESERWIPLLDRYGRDESEIYGVESIAPVPTNANAVYIAANHGRGLTGDAVSYNGEVLYSADRGKTWTATGLASSHVYIGANDSYRGTTGERLAVDPNRSDIVYLGTRKNGLWRKDGGAAWTQVSNGPPAAPSPGITFVVFDRASGTTADGRTKTIYVGAYGGGVWMSTDGGVSWKLIGGDPSPLRAAVTADGALFVTAGGDEGGSTGGVWRWKDARFQDVTPLSKFTSYSGVATDAAQPNIVAVAQNGGKVIYRSEDQGNSWVPVVKAPLQNEPAYYPKPSPANYNTPAGDWGNAALVVDPAAPSRLWQTNGYGVIRIERFASAAPMWRWEMNNLEELCVTAVKAPPLVALPGTSEPGADLMSTAADMVGFRHASRFQTPEATVASFAWVAQGSGIDYCATQPQYAAFVGWDQASSAPHMAMTGTTSDNGKTWTRFASATPGAGGKIAMSATNPANMVWAPSGAAPQYTMDSGKTWQRCHNDDANTDLPAAFQLSNEWWHADVLAADRVNGARFYYYANGILFYTDNGGANWRQGGRVLPAGDLATWTINTNLAVNPAKRDELWITFAANENNPNITRPYHSVDGGKSFQQVTTVERCNFMAFGKGATDGTPAMYMHGRANGESHDAIYQSTDLGQTWIRISDPAVQQFGSISSLEGDMRTRDLVYVGTGGRGIFYGQRPTFPAEGVVNAASYQGGGVAPGEIVALFGAVVGAEEVSVMAVDQPERRVTTASGGTRLLFDGVPAPMIYSSNFQTIAVAPYSLAGKSSTAVQVDNDGSVSDPVVLPVVPAAPGIFTLSGGAGQGAILNARPLAGSQTLAYSFNSESNPAGKGDYVVLFATGEGQTDPAGVDGAVSRDGALAHPILEVSAQLGGIPATVSYAGGAPGLIAGVMQVNVLVPATAPSGKAVPITLRVGDRESQPGVTVAIE